MTTSIQEKDVQLHQDLSKRFSLVVDFYNRYPGETVKYFIAYRKESDDGVGSLTINLPSGIQYNDYFISREDLIKDTFIRDQKSGQAIDIYFTSEVKPGEFIEIEIRTTVLPNTKPVYLLSIAELKNDQGEILESDSVRVSVQIYGNYMKYLPEIYHGSDFLGRFLMLFESFWKPVDQQINQIDTYFDPSLTPLDFLPWLASWVGVSWDETLPEERRRKLLQHAVMLYQKRGTKSALEEILKLYTAGDVEIVEYRSTNFVIGKSAKLGGAIALGDKNLPHTFLVKVKVDENEIQRMDTANPKKNQFKYAHKLEELIEQQKPAHTAFNLNLVVEQSDISKTTTNQIQEGMINE